jgi:uncharacterized protein YndB with AHSA1/START domain
MESNAFSYTIYIRTNRETLWEALTSAEYTWQYWGKMAIESYFTPGTAIQMVRESGEVSWRGMITEATDPSHIAFTWQLAQIGDNLPEAPTQVSIHLETHGSLVRLVLEQKGFSPGSLVFPVASQAWPAILSSLKSLLETGDVLVF